MADQQKSQADKAREAADEKRKAQEAEEAKRAAEAKAAEANQGTTVKDIPVPEAKPEDADTRSLEARFDAMERTIRMLAQGMAGGSGPAVGEVKDTTQVGPGAAIDPPMTGTAPAPGVTSGPATQPQPLSAAALGAAVPVSSARGLWNAATGGRSVVAREYPELRDEDVQVRRTGYYMDAIRNQGEILRGYSGPAGSWFVPVRILSQPDALRQWDALFGDRAPVLASDTDERAAAA